MAIDDLDRLPLAVRDRGQHVDQLRPALAIRAGELVEAHRAVDVLATQRRVGGDQHPLARQRHPAQLTHPHGVGDTVPLEQPLGETRPVRRRHQLGVADEEPHGRVEEPPLEIASPDEHLGLTGRHRWVLSSAPERRAPRHSASQHPNRRSRAIARLRRKQTTTKHLHIPSFAAAAVQAVLKNARRAADNPTRRDGHPPQHHLQRLPRAGDHPAEPAARHRGGHHRARRRPPPSGVLAAEGHRRLLLPRHRRLLHPLPPGRGGWAHRARRPPRSVPPTALIKIIWGPVQCSRGSRRAARFRCPQTPSAKLERSRARPPPHLGARRLPRARAAAIDSRAMPCVGRLLLVLLALAAPAAATPCACSPSATRCASTTAPATRASTTRWPRSWTRASRAARASCRRASTTSRATSSPPIPPRRRPCSSSSPRTSAWSRR